ncbi:MAG: cytochrome c biogenesis protein CcsA [Planctomycetes bacterium]|nr:cytochrome c biogenesis protein CcsA [Planctomycetota bacterium]
MADPAQSRLPFAVVALALLGLVGAQATLWLSHFYAPTQITEGSLWVVTPDRGAPINLYESYRIFFVHLPAAYATAICCGLALVGGVLWLLSRKPAWEALVVSAAEVGLFTGAIVLATGTLWGDYAWGSGRLGSGWNWEPRLTTMLILWLAFAALLVVRRAMDSAAQRSALTAVYGVLIGPLYPLVSWAVKLFGQFSHPADLSGMMSAPEVRTVRNVAQLGVLAALLALVALRFAWNRLAQRVEQERST